MCERGVYLGAGGADARERFTSDRAFVEVGCEDNVHWVEAGLDPRAERHAQDAQGVLTRDEEQRDPGVVRERCSQDRGCSADAAPYGCDEK